ncbi:hypothetical protein NG99_07300 [Erwinia typographi]|uniref:Uncharacterized protein n=1 Tax=Erwinia typographi TaxID=371042 RepID=A0A0A3ZAE4_9GAMM|nr:hypothetical protein [Erwinia typographi]KGT94774.1 hypothetical protein NG99_07300 [Erwinia typographi]
MSTHNVNVKTAAQEPSERYGLKGFSPVMAAGLTQQISLREQRLPLEERAELLCGVLVGMAEQVCASVTDWSQPRPLLALAYVSAWVAAGQYVRSAFGDLGEGAWDYAVRYLAVQLAAGYAMFSADVA